MPSSLPALLARGRAVPWVTVVTVATQVAREGKKRWDRLSKRDQQDLMRILKKLPGGPNAVTAADRATLRRIVGKTVSFD
ncbi:MAG TPA: hypothetical protein VNB64_02450 [Solirubrobacteraceae bacterium]|nr:hypothetical protein [Solirubrobacteraceae bacterium]